jgi:hypothetical protein
MKLKPGNKLHGGKYSLRRTRHIGTSYKQKQKKSKRRNSSLVSLEARLNRLLSRSKRKILRLSSRWKKTKRGHQRKTAVNFPVIPKTSFRKKDIDTKRNAQCCKQIMQMRRKYKEGQRILNEVDAFMGKK